MSARETPRLATASRCDDRQGWRERRECRERFAAEEQCRHCLQLFAFELEVRCRRCDGPACPFCMTRIEAGWICLVCTEVTDADEGNVES